MPAVADRVAGVTTDEFLADYSSVCPIHVDIARAGIEALSAFHRGETFDENLLSPLANIERRWYDSLDAGAPDYSIYNDQWYFADLWACWELASKGYLQDVAVISGAKALFSTDLPVVDLGCGLGHTTAALVEMFPRARVVGTNLQGTKQWEFCRTMADRHGFGLVSDIAEIAGPVAFVFASEYFEHIENPIRHVADVLATTLVVRYALSFDGLATKVNHHQTVSEYFTPKDQLRRNGFDRLIRLGIGLEDGDDLIAALNWSLHHANAVTAQDVSAWQDARVASLLGGGSC